MFILAVIGALSIFTAICFSVLWVYEDYHAKRQWQSTVNARRIISAPKMHWLLREFLKISDLKTQASSEKNDPLFMKALVAQEGAENMAKELLAYINGDAEKGGEEDERTDDSK